MLEALKALFHPRELTTLKRINSALRAKNQILQRELDLARYDLAQQQQRYSKLFRDFHDTINNCTTLTNALQDTKEELNQLKARIPKPIPKPLATDPFFHPSTPPTWRPNKPPYPPIIAEDKDKT